MNCSHGSGDGMECPECGESHTDWEAAGKRGIDHGGHFGIMERFECGRCGGYVDGGSSMNRTIESYCESCGETTGHVCVGENSIGRPQWDCGQCGKRKGGFLDWQWAGGQTVATDGGKHE